MWLCFRTFRAAGFESHHYRIHQHQTDLEPHTNSQGLPAGVVERGREWVTCTLLQHMLCHSIKPWDNHICSKCNNSNNSNNNRRLQSLPKHFTNSTCRLFLSVQFWMIYYCLCKFFILPISTITGSRAQKQTFSQGTTSYEIRGLQPSTDYVITLYTLYDGREESTIISTESTG